MSAPKKSSIRVTQPPTPCYCSVCDEPNAIRVQLVNPKVGGPLSFAVCEGHAEHLGFRLTNIVRRRRHLAGLASSRTGGQRT